MRLDAAALPKFGPNVSSAMWRLARLGDYHAFKNAPDNVCSKGSTEPGRPRHSDNQPPRRYRLKLPLPGSPARVALEVAPCGIT